MAQNLLRLLPDAVHPTCPLNDSDDGPGQVVVHDNMAVLKVLTLAQHVSGDKDAKFVLWLTLARSLVAVWAELPCKLGGIGGVAGDACQSLHSSTLELSFQIVNRVGELGEDQDLLVRKRLRK